MCPVTHLSLHSKTHKVEERPFHVEGLSGGPELCADVGRLSSCGVDRVLLSILAPESLLGWLSPGIKTLAPSSPQLEPLLDTFFFFSE